MIFIFIDSVLLAALIFGGLATGAGVTSVVVAFILKHKTVIVVITVLGVLVSEIVTYGEITDKIKAIIYIIINTVFDLILQTGYIVHTATFRGQQGRISRTVWAILNGQPSRSAERTFVHSANQYSL